VLPLQVTDFHQAHVGGNGKESNLLGGILKTMQNRFGLLECEII
jgi:hypothetical protein